MKIKEYRKKPVVIEAVQWTGENLREVIAFTDGPPETKSHHAGMMWGQYEALVRKDGLKIYTLEGKMDASPGDWIIKGVNLPHPNQGVSLRITGPNSDGEYWLHLKNGNGPQSGGINLGSERRGMIVSALLKAAAGGAA